MRGKRLPDNYENITLILRKTPSRQLREYNTYFEACRNMEGCCISTIFIVLVVAFIDIVLSDAQFRYMVLDPEPISLPFGYETLLTCEMDIDPDRFQWKFYPTDEPYNPNAFIDLSNSTFHLISEKRYLKERKKSVLPLQVNSTDIAGDYQCLAYYGAYAVASVPWRVTVAKLKDFPRQENLDVTVTAGNTVFWRCLLPESNPEVYIEYYKRDQFIASPYANTQIKSLILPSVSTNESGAYTCRATNSMAFVNSSTVFNLKVVNYAAPRKPYFIVDPKKTYTVLKGDSIFLECAAVGNPIPKVVWYKINGQLPSDRIEMLSGGLKISIVTSKDDGVYVCNHTNMHGTVSHHIMLIYNEEPSIECLMNSTDIKQDEKLDLDCKVKGVPEPKISWFLNGFSVINDSSVEAINNKIFFRPVKKRHAGNLQLFARNVVKTVYSSISISVIPLVSTDTSNTPSHTHHGHKNKSNSTKKPAKHMTPAKLIPPSKPIVSRMNDESVLVHWSVPDGIGLKIKFFKIQYRESGPPNSHDSHNRSRGSRWHTSNGDILPHIRDYEVTNLKPDHVYRFRIAAVYTNNDNKLSPNSDKYHLKRLDFDLKNPLPIPLITHTETINTTSVKIYWKFTKPKDVSIDGFYISYMSASTAGDYMKATVNGENTTEHIITHLQADTIYDIKLQSFNSKFPSEFSPIMKARTGANLYLQFTTILPIVATPSSEKAGFSLYVIVAGVILGCTLLICGVALLCICRKWQQKKSDNRAKSSVDEHHIQVDGNEYIVAPKSISRSNGSTPNRITITANPLADADNKTQNMIEMSCLTVQNNNCSPTQEPSSESTSQETPTNSKDKIKQKKRDKNKQNKQSVENISSGEKYL